MRSLTSLHGSRTAAFRIFDLGLPLSGSIPELPHVAKVVLHVRSRAPGTVRIGIETGPTTTWLWTELNRLGLPVICIDARHAKAVLKMQINKSDRNDAAGIARIMQTRLV